MPGGPHAERAAPGHDEVGAADQLRRQRRGEAAAHVQVPRAAAEQALGRGRRRQQRAALIRQLLQRLPGSAAAGAPARDEHRLLRRPQRGGERLDLSLLRRGRLGSGGPGRAARRARSTRPPAHPAAWRAPRSGVPAPPSGTRGRRRRSPGSRSAAPPGWPRRPRVSASTPIRKLDCTAEALTSAASTSMGVRLLAASVIPVSAFVMPGPWCRLRIAGRPVLRAHASAMHAAPFSCRAATNRAPRATSAFVTMKFPLPTTPKMVSAPRSASAAATAS